MGTSNIKPTFDGEPDTAKGATDLSGAVMTGEPPEEQTSSPRDKEVKIWLPLIKDIFKLPELKPKLEQFFIKDKIKKGTQVTLNKDELEKFLDRKNKDYRPFLRYYINNVFLTDAAIKAAATAIAKDEKSTISNNDIKKLNEANAKFADPNLVKVYESVLNGARDAVKYKIYKDILMKIADGKRFEEATKKTYRDKKATITGKTELMDENPEAAPAPAGDAPENTAPVAPAPPASGGEMSGGGGHGYYSDSSDSSDTCSDSTSNYSYISNFSNVSSRLFDDIASISSRGSLRSISSGDSRGSSSPGSRGSRGSRGSMSSLGSRGSVNWKKVLRMKGGSGDENMAGGKVKDEAYYAEKNKEAQDDANAKEYKDLKKSTKKDVKEKKALFFKDEIACVDFMKKPENDAIMKEMVNYSKREMDKGKVDASPKKQSLTEDLYEAVSTYQPPPEPPAAAAAAVDPNAPTKPGADAPAAPAVSGDVPDAGEPGAAAGPKPDTAPANTADDANKPQSETAANTEPSDASADKPAGGAQSGGGGKKKKLIKSKQKKLTKKKKPQHINININIGDNNNMENIDVETSSSSSSSSSDSDSESDTVEKKVKKMTKRKMN